MLSSLGLFRKQSILAVIHLYVSTPHFFHYYIQELKRSWQFLSDSELQQQRTSQRGNEWKQLCAPLLVDVEVDRHSGFPSFLSQCLFFFFFFFQCLNAKESNKCPIQLLGENGIKKHKLSEHPSLQPSPKLKGAINREK